MDSYEFNKIAGAVLGSLLVILGLNVVAGAVVSSRPPATPGFNLPALDEASVAPQAGATIDPIAVRLAKGDMAKGQAEARACVACHIFTQTGDKKPGPPLWNVVNRPIAHEQFAYTAAMKEFGEKNGQWDFAHLDTYLTAPRTVVKGTAMNFGGIGNAQRRADLILYLRSLSDKPADLPAAP